MMNRHSLLARTGAALAIARSAGGCQRLLRGSPTSVLDEDGQSRAIGNVAHTERIVEKIGDNSVTAVEFVIQYIVDGRQADQTSRQLGRIEPGERERYQMTRGTWVRHVTNLYADLSAELA